MYSIESNVIGKKCIVIRAISPVIGLVGVIMNVSQNNSLCFRYEIKFENKKRLHIAAQDVFIFQKVFKEKDLKAIITDRDLSNIESYVLCENEDVLLKLYNRIRNANKSCTIDYKQLIINL